MDDDGTTTPVDPSVCVGRIGGGGIADRLWLRTGVQEAEDAAEREGRARWP